mgnify:CR=1 FL=1
MISLSIPVDKIPFIRSIEGRKFRDGKWLFPESSYETLVKYGLLDKEYKVEKFVVGLPKNMNNTEGPRVEASKAYGDKIKEIFGIPVDYQDERLTTVQAERMLVEQADVSRGKRKKVIDKLAAQLILQNYLDRMF